MNNNRKRKTDNSSEESTSSACPSPKTVKFIDQSFSSIDGLDDSGSDYEPNETEKDLYNLEQAENEEFFHRNHELNDSLANNTDINVNINEVVLEDIAQSVVIDISANSPTNVSPDELELSTIRASNDSDVEIIFETRNETPKTQQKDNGTHFVLIRLCKHFSFISRFIFFCYGDYFFPLQLLC